MKFCPFCGAGLQSEMVFCPKCGKKFVDALSGLSETTPVVYEEVCPNDTNQNNIAETMPEKVSAKTRNKSRKGVVVAIILVLALAAIALGILFLSSKEPLPFSDDTEAIKAASNSVVMLNCYDKDGSLYATGSAFAAFENGVFITNYHVICGDVYKIEAQTESGMQFDITKVIAYSESKDLAIIKTDAETDMQISPIGDSQTLEKGTKVVAIGSPLGLINSVSTGVFSGTVAEEGQNYLQFTASISHGSSGGALFNNAGEVIGITSASYIDGQNLNLAIPIEVAVELYNENINKSPITFKAFYDSQVHALPLEIVLENPYEYKGESICVEAYVSTVYHLLIDNPTRRIEFLDFYLVSNYDDVWGFYFDGDITDADYDLLDDEKERLFCFRSAKIGWLHDSLLNSFVIDEMLNLYQPGDKIIMTCEVDIVTFTQNTPRFKGEYSYILLRPQTIDKLIGITLT